MPRQIKTTPIAMIIAQSIIIIPIMISLILKNIEEDFNSYREELISYGANFKNILILLIRNKITLYITIALIGFGRAISEYGAAAIVGGSIDHITRNVTASIALETSKGNLDVAIGLGSILIVISFILSFFEVQIINGINTPSNGNAINPSCDKFNSNKALLSSIICQSINSLGVTFKALDNLLIESPVGWVSPFSIL